MLKSSLMRTKPVAVRSVCSVIPTSAVRVTPRSSARQLTSRVAGHRSIVMMVSSEQAVAEQVHTQEPAQESAPAVPASRPAAMLKLVISHSMAGAFIGTKGIRLNETVVSSGASIKIASRQALFSGTNERTALVYGTTESISSAMSMLMQQKLVAEVRDAELAANTPVSADEDIAARLTGQEQLVLLLAVSSPVGEIFTQEQLSSIGARSGAELQLSTEEYGTEKVVSVSGIREQVSRALNIVMPLLTAEPQYVKYMDQILVGPERNIKSLREPRSPREPRADAAPRERRVREPRAPREPRPDAPPVEPYSFDTMKSSSQLFLDADVVNTLMTTNIDAVNDIAQSTGTTIVSTKGTKFATLKTIVQVVGPTAAVTAAVEKMVNLLSTLKQ